MAAAVEYVDPTQPLSEHGMTTLMHSPAGAAPFAAAIDDLRSGLGRLARLYAELQSPRLLQIMAQVNNAIEAAEALRRGEG